MKNILITGATGFVGINIIKELLKNKDNCLFLLVRGTDDSSANERVISLLEEHYDGNLEEIIKGITVLEGDVAEKNLGLTDNVLDSLTQEINEIFHSAASINFKLPIELAVKINVTGTDNVFKFAKKCFENGVLKRINHISTAYVAGNTKERFYENQLDIGQGFDNTYEATKLEAEKLVHKYIEKGLPAIIFRPSVIASNSLTGEISKSNLIFGFMKQILNTRYNEFICSENSSLNIIPINYFINAMLHISASDSSIGKTFNIVNSHNSSIRELIRCFCEITGVRVPDFVPVDEADKVPPRIYQLLEVFITYIEKSHTFDDRATKEALRGTPIECPDIDEEYMKKAVQYCSQNRLFNERELGRMTANANS